MHGVSEPPRIDKRAWLPEFCAEKNVAVSTQIWGRHAFDSGHSLQSPHGFGPIKASGNGDGSLAKEGIIQGDMQVVADWV